MQNILDHTKRQQRFFEEMTRIPHGSYHEQAYGDYLERFASQRGLLCRRDEIGNVVIYKPGCGEAKDHAPVAIQAHMDMVWAQDARCRIDQTKDALELYIEDGYLRARGTTLGADDGTGVAYMLAVLDDADAVHPPLEAIFTVQEEVGLNGALALDPAWVTARRFISLDCGGGDEIYISSLAGHRGVLRRTVRRTPTQRAGYCLTVSGLKGGYSTAYMDEQANANHLAAVLLKRLNARCGITLSKVDGGEVENQLAKACAASFTSGAAKLDVKKVFSQEADALRRELGPAEPNLSITLSDAEVPTQMDANDSRAVLDLMFLLPCGFRHRHTQFSEIMSECVNWSLVRTEEDAVELTYVLRTSTDAMMERLKTEIDVLRGLFDAEDQTLSSFPAWEFHDSELLHTLQRVFKAREGKEIGLIPVQGGLECGVFAQRYPDMDIIAMGPFGYDVHTPNEHMDLANFDSLFKVFCDLLAAL